MYIKISNTAREIKGLDLKGESVVVIDVLRATTTMINALYHGVDKITTFSDIEEARAYKKKFPEAVLGGERNAIKPEDFDCGNSPLEYTKFQGRELALTTTNGTLALNNAKGADEILIMSFHNVEATCTYLKSKKSNIRFVCAGTEGEFSLDDALCAVEAVNLLKETYEIDDMSKLLLASLTHREELLKKAKHYNTLIKKGFEDDLIFAISKKNHNFIGIVEKACIIKKYI